MVENICLVFGRMHGCPSPAKHNGLPFEKEGKEGGVRARFPSLE